VYSAFNQSDAPTAVFNVAQQVITATAQQTTFTLTTFTYLPGTDTLEVYRNGLHLTVNTDYVETNSSTITLTSPAALGDELMFRGGTVITGNQTPGSQVSFLQAGTGAVTRNMQDKARESVSVLDFGAVGNGTTNDSTALTLALSAAGSSPVVLEGGDFYLGPSGYTLAAGNGAISFVDGAQKNVWLHTRRLTGIQQVGAGPLIGFSPTAYMWDTLEDCNVGSDFFVASRHRHRFGGSSAYGGRIGLYSSIEQSAATNASNANRNYVGIQSSTYCNTSDTGTDTGANAKGAFFGGGFATYVEGAAQNLLNVTAAEFNTFVKSGASVKYQFGLQIAGANAQRGAGYDAAINISGLANAIPHAGYGVGILFSSANGAEPFSSTSTIIAAVTNSGASVQHGIDFSSYTITGKILQGKYSSLSENTLVVGDFSGFSVIQGGSQSTNASLILRPKGTGSVYIQNGAGNKDLIRCDDTGYVLMNNLPSSSAGLPSGALWKNGTVINIVP
jgi:hypothetical protein